MPPLRDVRWVYQDRRCRRWVLLYELPDTTLVNSLREALAHSFLWNIPA
jgi:hypothetical protein